MKGDAVALFVKQLQIGPMQNFVYLIGPADGREVAVVDPAWDLDAILGAVRAEGKELVAALVTHHHQDHINALAPLLSALPTVRAYAQRKEVEFSAELQALGERLTAVDPGESVAVGELGVKCMHTPGHTPGSQCFHAESAVFTGDTLFICGCGRCDFPGGDPEAMFDSLHRVLGGLPDETIVYPGHDYADRPTSTIAAEKGFNPYFLHRDLASFVSFRMRPR
ncbi:MBL fold metallo-hydrolase [Vulgatibacter incomptus]|uniref:Hydroxyacylglutathione hydrolase n=1 Tax=Vulgatibacter incomptus TaxID=1391653 RepID=A0A0K1PEX9_9BACT|nr:MBL fold metallo-hydrolase [Vulgatibacter incomptus]AKU92062.1 Hydroxyacylglutathione hydrolase [Vulgatibacter incomptus]